MRWHCCSSLHLLLLLLFLLLLLLLLLLQLRLLLKLLLHLMLRLLLMFRLLLILLLLLLLLMAPVRLRRKIVQLWRMRQARKSYQLEELSKLLSSSTKTRTEVD